MDEPAPAAEEVQVDRLFRLDGKAAIVAGAASPLGRAAASGLAACGCALLLADRAGPALDAAAGAVAGARAVPLDPRDPARADEIAGAGADALGRLDGLVLAAGADDPAHHAADVAAALDRGVTARAALAGAVARRLIAAGAGGWIVVVEASGDDLASRAGAGALVQLTRELARQWAPHGIRVNGLSVAPGWRPADVDGAVAFLASEASRFITGVTLTLDGGRQGATS